jgi:hypothetical protein
MTATATIVECPQCGKKGKTVPPVTLRALLKQQYAAEVYIPEESNCEVPCTPSKGKTGWRSNAKISQRPAHDEGEQSQ